MEIQSASYVIDHGRPFLDLVLNGHQARISPEQRFLTEGYVYLSTPEIDFSWEEFLSKITVPPCELTDNREMEIMGHTNDPVVVQMTKDFLESVRGDNFHAQSNISIPGRGDEPER